MVADMKMIAIALALLLVGTSYAQTALTGYIWGGKNWHAVYVSDDGMLPVATNHGTVIFAYGTFRWPSDGSPGYITIMKQEWGAMAGVLAHEVCHARQQDGGQPQSEAGCK
jgi:hypothetical protein